MLCIDVQRFALVRSTHESEPTLDEPKRLGYNGPMSFEEQIRQLIETDKRIQERHQALAESVELVHHDMQQWMEHVKDQDRKFDELRRSLVRGMIAFLQPEKGSGDQNV